MSNKTFSTAAWDALHFTRSEAFARRIELIYQQVIQEATAMARKLTIDPAKPFSFSDYPGAEKQVNELLLVMAGRIGATITAGQESEWNLANLKNDALIESVLDTSLIPKASLARLMPRNLEALAAFQARKTAGLGLSERVWKHTGQFKTELELGLDVGLGEGKSASQLSRDMRAYLNEPDRLFRRVRNKRGNLVLSKAAAAYHPGQGTYRSSYKNAMRLSRTEINMAYREADHERWQKLDVVVGFEVRRSNNPYGCDVCESLKGRYPKTFKFVGWHPNCRCNAVPILVSAEELRRMNRMLLNGEPTEGFVSQNEVRDLPANFNEWAIANDTRLSQAKTPPLFMADNIKQGKFTLKLPTKPDIDLSTFISGDKPTDRELKAIITEFARIRPANFSGGLGSVSIFDEKLFIMQHTRYKHNGQWVTPSNLSISSHTFSVGGKTFNPLEELRSAMGAMKAGNPLRFGQEYAVESLWHEILHAKSQTPPRKFTKLTIQPVETLNQFCARHTYGDFLQAFGYEPAHQASILDNGYGYKQFVAAFRANLKRRGIDEKQALADLLPVLLNDYGLVKKKISDYLKQK